MVGSHPCWGWLSGLYSDSKQSATGQTSSSSGRSSSASSSLVSSGLLVLSLGVSTLWLPQLSSSVFCLPFLNRWLHQHALMAFSVLSIFWSIAKLIFASANAGACWSRSYFKGTLNLSHIEFAKLDFLLLKLTFDSYSFLFWPHKVLLPSLAVLSTHGFTFHSVLTLRCGYPWLCSQLSFYPVLWQLLGDFCG